MKQSTPNRGHTDVKAILLLLILALVSVGCATQSEYQDPYATAWSQPNVQVPRTFPTHELSVHPGVAGYAAALRVGMSPTEATEEAMLFGGAPYWSSGVSIRHQALYFFVDGAVTLQFDRAGQSGKLVTWEISKNDTRITRTVQRIGAS